MSDTPKKLKDAPPTPPTKPKPKVPEITTGDSRSFSKNNDQKLNKIQPKESFATDSKLEKTKKDIVPPTIKTNIKDDFLEYKSGSTLELSFDIDTNSPTEINVYKDEELIEAEDNHIQIIKDGTNVKIKIDKLSIADSGFYVIEAENDAGLTDKEIEINVKGKT